MDTGVRSFREIAKLDIDIYILRLGILISDFIYPRKPESTFTYSFIEMKYNVNLLDSSLQVLWVQ